MKSPGLVLLEAVQKGDDERVMEALKNEPDMNLTTSAGNTALHLACENGKLDLVGELISRGWDVNKPNMQLISPFYMAIIHKRVQVVEVIM